MTEGDATAEQAPELTCANCGRPLDAADKFCRECGLPTPRQAQTQKQVPALPPDTGEMQRALDAVPDPTPFARVESAPAAGPPEGGEATTSSVVRATSPTFAFQMASSTLVMLGVFVVLAVLGIVFLVLAVRQP